MTTKKTTPAAGRAKPGTASKAGLKTKPKSKTAPRTAVGSAPSLYPRLHSLLHAVRSIAQYEDALCELTHEAKGGGALSADAGKTLRGILAKIPADDYMRELDGVSMLVGAGAGTKKAGRASSK
jgi:hypothetical protein